MRKGGDGGPDQIKLNIDGFEECMALKFCGMCLCRAWPGMVVMCYLRVS